jgi:hypothetical protein
MGWYFIDHVRQNQSIVSPSRSNHVDLIAEDHGANWGGSCFQK